MTLTDLQRQSLKQRGFTEEDIDRAGRFGHPHVALSAYVGKEGMVSTPDGIGKLEQARSTHCLVSLMRAKPTRQRKSGEWYAPMRRYRPEELRPA